MSATGLHNLDNAVQKANIWLRDLDDKLGWDDRQKSYMALRVVLHALRDRLSVEESAHLAAQLPMLVRGLYYEGWRPSDVPSKERGIDAFLERVSENYKQAPGPGKVDPERITRNVFALLSEKITEGEIRKVKGMLPRQFSRLWEN